MNMHVSTSTALATIEPVGPSDFNAFLEKTLPQLPADAAALIPLYQAYRASAEALRAVINEPRTPSLAADLIGDEFERANNHACAIAEKLSRLTSVPKFWSG